MRHIIVERTDDGYVVDQRPYVAWLDDHADELPPGARALALDPEHRDHWHEWSPRSATFETLSTQHTDDAAAGTLVLRAFAGGPVGPRYVVRYQDVSQVELDGDRGGRPRPDVLAYEFVTHPDGVEHGIAFRGGGSIRVVARDLTAGWYGGGSDVGLKDDTARIDPDNPATRARLMRRRPAEHVADDRYVTLATAVRWRSDLFPQEHGVDDVPLLSALDTDEGRDLRDQWAQCLEERGVTPPPDDDPYDMVPSGERDAPFDEQVRVGLVDVACKDRLDLVQRLADIDAGLQTEYLEQTAEYQAAVQARTEEAVEASRRYLAEHGIDVP